MLFYHFVTSSPKIQSYSEALLKLFSCLTVTFVDQIDYVVDTTLCVIFRIFYKCEAHVSLHQIKFVYTAYFKDTASASSSLYAKTLHTNLVSWHIFRIKSHPFLLKIKMLNILAF